MSEEFALHQGAFGRAVVLYLRADLVPHSHADSQIAFWLGGAQAQARVGGELVRYSERMALGTNAFEQHDLTLLDRDEPSVFLCFHVSRDWLEERRRATGRPFAFSSPQVPIDATLRRACWRVLDLMISAHGSRTRIDEEVERLLESAMDATMVDPPAGAAVSSHPVLDHRLRRAIAYMRAHVAEKLSVEDVAARVGLSRAHFFALFRDQLHTTPQVFWSAVRVEEAIRRLLHEGESLTSMAIDLGFSAPGNFSRFFKEQTGVPPSAYRRAASEPALGLVTGVPREQGAGAGALGRNGHQEIQQCLSSRASANADA